SPSLTTSTPLATCRATASFTASAIVALAADSSSDSLRSRANSTSVTACERGKLPTSVTRIRSRLVFNAPPSPDETGSTEHVVGAMIAGQPALELGMRIGPAPGVDLLHLGMIDGELDDHAV